MNPDKDLLPTTEASPAFSLVPGKPWDPLPAAILIPIFLPNLAPPTPALRHLPHPPEINVIIAMCACLPREWVGSPPPGRQVPRGTHSHCVRPATAEHCLCRWAAASKALSVITPALHTCACVRHSGNGEVREMADSQPVESRGLTGSVGGDSAS